jgi:hypothetical protein
MIVHTITTTKESIVQDCLEKYRREEKKAFVLTTRIANDDAHVRYNVFMFVNNEK